VAGGGKTCLSLESFIYVLSKTRSLADVTLSLADVMELERPFW